jgi:hypothetical protein
MRSIGWIALRRSAIRSDRPKQLRIWLPGPSVQPRGRISNAVALKHGHIAGKVVAAVPFTLSRFLMRRRPR